MNTISINTSLSSAGWIRLSLAVLAGVLELAVVPYLLGSEPQSARAEEVSDLLRRIEGESERCVIRAPDGGLISVTVPPRYVTDHNLELIASSRTLQTIRIIATRDMHELSARGVVSLKALKNLRALAFQCAGRLPPGVLEAVAALDQIQHLELIGAEPSDAREYAALTNLQNLVSLRITHASQFGGDQLVFLNSLPKLRSVSFAITGLSESDAAALVNLRNLTNCLVWEKGWSLHMKRCVD